MNTIGEYTGVLLNHCEAVYRPGDRELAKEFLAALGMAVREFPFTANSPSQMFMVHPEPADQDPTTNIIFLHQMSPAQTALDELLREKLQSDPALSEAYAGWREFMTAAPGGTPHLGVRYHSMEALDSIKEKLAGNLSLELAARVTVNEMAPYPARPGMPNIRQVFVYSDVLTTSMAGYGQLFELQVERT